MAQTSSQRSLEQAVAQFVTGFDLGQLTPGALDGVKRLMEDQLGLQVGCSRLPWCGQVEQYALAQSRPGRSRIMASDRLVSAIDAAFVNATFGHSFEYDDAHRQSASHPGSCVVSSALAVAEELGATLDEVVAAIVVGYEVYTRLGCLAAPDLLTRGFHPHAILSTFGAAAVTARLRGFDERTTGHALAIAMSHASGTTEYTSSGGSVKRVHSGIGTRSGIVAADMASAGITGPLDYLTGPKGFYRTFLQRPVASDALSWFEPSAPFQIEKVWIKPHLCCGCIHAYIDAARQLRDRAGDITGLTIRIQSSANTVVGTKNIHAYAPETIEHVQYSLPVQMAFTLLGLGNGYLVHLGYLDGKLDLSPDGQILKTARMIEIIEDPELDKRYPGKFVADVTATFRDGTSQHVFVEDSAGTVENPMSQKMLDEKFSEIAAAVLDEGRVAAFLKGIKALDGRASAASLTALSSPSGGSREAGRREPEMAIGKALSQ
ncbi:MmgE/PrpD family protein [Bosea sp. MMO-172]|uniref:MmgE/PrpD family protein n=1 Tax=Bosea sp. MMO-172 TaxID=3127885 RepID=UPI0030175C4E